MSRSKKELDLLRSYRRLSRDKKGRNDLLHNFYTPIAAVLVLCILVWSVLLRLNAILLDKTDDISNWLNDPTVIEQYNEAIAKQQENDRLVQSL